jgi:hypothetical protein
MLQGDGDGRRVGGGETADLVVVDVVLEGGHLGRRVARQRHLREAGAERRHAGDVVHPVGERRRPTHRVAQPLEAEHLVLRSHLERAGRGVPIHAGLDGERVDHSVGADGPGRHVRHDRRGGRIGVRARVGDELAADGAQQLISRRVVGAAGVEVVDIALADDLERAAVDRRAGRHRRQDVVLTHGRGTTGGRRGRGGAGAGATAARTDDHRDDPQN